MPSYPPLPFDPTAPRDPATGRRPKAGGRRKGTPNKSASGWYHERRDDMRGIGIGPKHDWSSLGADAFGLMCIACEEPGPPPLKRREPPNRPIEEGGRMG